MSLTLLVSDSIICYDDVDCRESWLRGRRKDPPTPEELEKNYAIAQMKKINYAKLEAKADEERGYKIESKTEKGMESFPDYQGEYEKLPGVAKPRRN